MGTKTVTRYVYYREIVYIRENGNNRQPDSNSNSQEKRHNNKLLTSGNNSNVTPGMQDANGRNIIEYNQKSFVTNKELDNDRKVKIIK